MRRKFFPLKNFFLPSYINKNTHKMHDEVKKTSSFLGINTFLLDSYFTFPY